MSAYSAADEESIRTRKLLKDWAGEGLITPEQYVQMEQETVCGLRRTNVFLRSVLFIFGLIIVGAGLGLIFAVFFSRPDSATTGVLLCLAAAACYGAAEYVVAEKGLYRYGIEESLAVCAVVLLCVGTYLAFFGSRLGAGAPPRPESLVPAVGVIASLWLWHRFGFLYAPVAAMLLAAGVPWQLTSSPWTQHVIVASLYAAGLAVAAQVRPASRASYLHAKYSMVRACLWLGVYVAMNLQLSWLGRDFRGAAKTSFPATFFWATWVAIWCLPPLILAVGLRRKDRFITAAGLIAAVLTLATNKSYLGWERHSWDPMLLGALLVGVAVVGRRWLEAGPDGVRLGYTAKRLSGRDKQWMATGSAAVGFLPSHSVAMQPGAAKPEVRFGGGDSGGGGASSDY